MLLLLKYIDIDELLFIDYVTKPQKPYSENKCPLSIAVRML